MKHAELLAINAQNWRDLGPGMDPDVAKDLGYTPFEELDELVAEIPAHAAAFQRIGGIPTRLLVEEVASEMETDHRYKQYGYVPMFSDIPKGSSSPVTSASQQARTHIQAAAARQSWENRNDG
jgi:hypothetical protein